MYEIYTDVPISRRKIFNHVVDHDETLLFSSSSLAACISWVLEKGETEMLLQRPDEKIAITAIRVPS